MEQYIHTFIAADAAFTPQPQQVPEFFDALITAFSFRIISNTRWQPGFRVMKPGLQLGRPKMCLREKCEHSPCLIKS
jgi:hypothetical protein